MRVSLNRKRVKLYKWISLILGIFCLIWMIFLDFPYYLSYKDAKAILLLGGGLEVFYVVSFGSLIINIVIIIFGLKVDKMERSGLAKAGIILTFISLTCWFISFCWLAYGFIGYTFIW
jgi:hypothetical protein